MRKGETADESGSSAALAAKEAAAAPPVQPPIAAESDGLQALWADTCDLGSSDPSLTLSRLPTASALSSTRAVRPTPGALVDARAALHNAATVDFARETVARLDDAGDESIGLDTLAPDDGGLAAAPALARTSGPGAAAPAAPALAQAAAPQLEVFDATMGAEELALQVGVPAAAVSTHHPRPAATASAQLVGPPPGLASAGQAGGSVYALLAKIGEGGMGVVWRARQESLGREVAIKALRSEIDTPEARQRFVAEAVITGSLDHPNVVPVHELGVGTNGEVFLAMKLVDGHAWNDLLHPQTADHHAAAQAFDLRRHLDVLSQVANAVAFAHSRGVVHRDLKPANVMVGAFGEVVVMDWGIAVDIREPRPAQVRGVHKLDVIGPAGTPANMAPELATGRGAEIGPATDVFLLGAILYEITTGFAPHRGRTLVEVLMAAARAEPPTWPDSAPSALREICHRAMAARPADRHPNAEAFAADLRTYLEHEASVRLSDQGDVLRRPLERGEVARRDRYGRWLQAQQRYQQALELWSDNASAQQGAATSTLALCEEALGRGDIGLAEAQLDALRPLAAAGDGKAAAAVAAVERQRSRGRGARWWTVAAVASQLALAALAVSVVTHNGAIARDEARQADIARALRGGWEAVAAGDAGEMASAIERLTQLRGEAPAQVADGAAQTTADSGDLDSRIEALRTAQAVALWQRGDAAQLFKVLCPQAGRGPGTAKLRRGLRQVAAVRGTALSAALDEIGRAHV